MNSGDQVWPGASARSLEPIPQIYLPSAQSPRRMMTLLARTRSEPTLAVAASRSAVWAVDPNQPVDDVRTMDQYLCDEGSSDLVLVTLFSTLALFALAVGAMGIYGVMSYLVSEREPEISVRMALGAEEGDVLLMIHLRGGSLLVIGTAIGLVGALLMSRILATLLVERILELLGLRDTAPNPKQPAAFAFTDLDRRTFMDRMAAGYEVSGSDVNPRQHPDHLGASAGLVASAEDVARFSMAIDEGRFLSSQGWDQVLSPAISNEGTPLPYGLGWFIQDYQGIRLEWHYGYWTTNSSLIPRVPDRKLTLVVLANTQTLSFPYGLGSDGNVLRSDVASLFVVAFVLGDEALPAGR